MKGRSTTHQEAFQDLSMIEITVLEFLEDMEETADESLKESIEEIRGEVLNA